ncbi:MAG TPA: ABC transporter ATP-binding protein [Acidimicrobiales bacterium]|nr:ABC transporter ATP-binding protein [Acidimicrobiales bacterium]
MTPARRHVSTSPDDFHLAGRDLLDVVDLRTSFHTPRGVVKAVDGVSLALARGRTLGLVGESGCGKSVLSRSIMGLLPSTARRQGTITFAGVRLDELGPAALREYWGTQMSMVFQDPMTSLNPVMRIGRQIMESLEVHTEMSRADARETALALLRSVHIPEAERRLRQYPHELSGGMRQRVVIAVALACGPQLLFADEPTTALDVTVQAQILDLLGEQQRERDMAVVLVSHDLGVVAGRTHDIAVMYAGQIVEQAPTSTLFSEVRMPYTEALLRSVPRLENESHTRLSVIGGRPPDLIDPPAGCRFAPRCPYVQPRCLEEQPPLVEAETPGHLYRCWYPVGTDAGREALESNLAAQLPQAEAAVSGAVSGDLAVEAS